MSSFRVAHLFGNNAPTEGVTHTFASPWVLPDYLKFVSLVINLLCICFLFILLRSVLFNPDVILVLSRYNSFPSYVSKQSVFKAVTSHFTFTTVYPHLGSNSPFVFLEIVTNMACIDDFGGANLYCFSVACNCVYAALLPSAAGGPAGGSGYLMKPGENICCECGRLIV